MPLPLPSDLVVRTTYWSTHRGDVERLAVGLIRESDRDLLVECVSDVGPFDTPEDVLAATLNKALAARDRQMAGQELLPF